MCELGNKRSACTQVPHFPPVRPLDLQEPQNQGHRPGTTPTPQKKSPLSWGWAEILTQCVYSLDF